MPPSRAGSKNIVLVHGGFVDGSGWQGVYDILKKDGYNVVIVQNPTTSLADDVAATKRALAGIDGNAILVGHSYGGAVVTEAGTDPKVAGVVYIAAFAPDKGELVNSLIGTFPKDGPQPPILPPTDDGFLFLDKEKMPKSFAADVKPECGGLHGRLQVPWGINALGGTITAPAWRVKPTWYLVATDDMMIPLDAQRIMSKRRGLHLVEEAGQPCDLRLKAGNRGQADRDGRRNRHAVTLLCALGIRSAFSRPGPSVSKRTRICRDPQEPSHDECLPHRSGSPSSTEARTISW